MSRQVGDQPSREVIAEGQPQENDNQPENRHDNHGPRLRGTAQRVHEEKDHERGLDDGDRLPGDDPHDRELGTKDRPTVRIVNPIRTTRTAI